jgi:anti-sigma factor RsiW
MTSCRDIHDSLLTSYIDGECDASTRARVDAHLGACAECRALLAHVQATQDIFNHVPAENAPEHLWSSIRERIESPAGQSLWATILAGLNPFEGAHQRQAAMALITLIILAGTVPVILGRPSGTTVQDESTAFIAMANEQEQTLFGDNSDQITSAEYFINGKGEMI